MTQNRTNSAVPQFLRLRGWRLGCLLSALILIPLGVYGLDQIWPYRYRNVKPTLESVFASNIDIKTYHRTYFPHPGFVADGLVLRRRSALNLPPVGSVDHIRVDGRWIDLLLLRNRIYEVTADGLHVVIPPVGSAANKEDFPPGSSADFTGPSTLIQQLVLRNAKLDILRVNGGRYSFPIERLVIRDLSKSARISYVVDMKNAMPTGDIHAKGTFGPLLANQLGATPVTGDFSFTSVQLSDIQDLNGTLASSGHFQGRLEDIEASAQARVPDFAVSNGQPTVLAGNTTSMVNALNGDVLLRAVDLHVAKSTVHLQGGMAGSPKIADFDIAIEKGRTEDLLRPFMKSASPVAGALRLHSHAHLAAAAHGSSFLQRLTMTGDLDGPAERLTDAGTEQELTAFSVRARGKHDDPGGVAADGNVLSRVGAHVAVRDGVAHISEMKFDVPGAGIDLNGIFNLSNQNVKMTGNLRMQTNLSHVTTGWKSFLLKPLAPFFKRKDAGAVVPIVVSGSPGHYAIGQNVIH
jgi:hypothetical protein